MKTCTLKTSFVRYGVCLTPSTSKNSPRKTLIYFTASLTQNLEPTLSQHPTQTMVLSKLCRRFSVPNIWRWIEEGVSSNNYTKIGAMKCEFIGISCSMIQKMGQETIKSFRKREQPSKEALWVKSHGNSMSYFRLLISRNKLTIR